MLSSVKMSDQSADKFVFDDCSSSRKKKDKLTELILGLMRRWENCGEDKF